MLGEELVELGLSVHEVSRVVLRPPGEAQQPIEASLWSVFTATIRHGVDLVLVFLDVVEYLLSESPPLGLGIYLLSLDSVPLPGLAVASEIDLTPNGLGEYGVLRVQLFVLEVLPDLVFHHHLLDDPFPVLRIGVIVLFNRAFVLPFFLKAELHFRFLLRPKRSFAPGFLILVMTLEQDFMVSFLHGGEFSFNELLLLQVHEIGCPLNFDQLSKVQDLPVSHWNPWVSDGAKHLAFQLGLFKVVEGL
mmetsp:Transcript_20646/g.31485  ORF Transcript_20646/g.31485 Transcript_20646/m.31485 type:complete len:247 (-) Transcript_20646:6647-7387(-)